MPNQLDAHIRDFVTYQQVKAILAYPLTFKAQTAEQVAMLKRLGL